MEIPGRDKITGTTKAFGKDATTVLEVVGELLDGQHRKVYFADDGRKGEWYDDVPNARWIITVTVERDS